MYLKFIYKQKEYEYRNDVLSKGLFYLDKENKTYVEVKNITKVLQEEINKAVLSFNNSERKTELIEELSKLDYKLIRPLAEKEADRIQEILSKKQTLRDELRGLDGI